MTSTLHEQKTDFQLVEKTLNYYLEGGLNNDYETLSKAFHETATMKSITDGYQETNALNFFRKKLQPGPKQNRTSRIASIHVSGNAASAHIEIEYPTYIFLDYMNLLKIDGEWKIVSKIFYKKEKKS